ncbi:uncharacterized protein LDX57_010417 [Aspergillus melleus]|uniref:uncharacterized protein n=1 Tax=Aspergillus melleus TaxID=138277 RepID=UPI001E8E8019|nr:uncharacterized protein LDX57_010417 [Aspergillus melleus]KAH8432790.1 hypothetical protein LDX57_010417 [Aspergillus melleus]
MASASDKFVHYKTLSHDDYTVGWICALPVELTAAKGMLDKRHESLPQPANDNNNYVLGEITGHNVVIACLPIGEYGTTSAATVAAQMLLTFCQIRFGLMVGIGGGVPTTEDIRLGDVVVSNPTDGYGGVIQYDYGKTISRGTFVRTGMLNMPPQNLRTATANLRSEHQMRPNRIPELVAEMSRKYPQMSELLEFDRSADDLYSANYTHISGNDTCSDCDRSKSLKREPRLSQNPKIHYGLVASGNQVVKDAETRDRYAREMGIICFEMEAAGLMNHFPCLVIRGICDYSDSHKNKKWQAYAAATAAAYTKELLSVTSVSVTQSIITARRSPAGPETLTVDDPARFLALSQRPEWALVHQLEQPRNIFQRLSDYDPDRTHRSHLWDRCPHTTEWIVDNPAFKAWLGGSASSVLWLTGKIGCGKTLVSSTVIQHLKSITQGTQCIVAHFFYSHSNRSRLDARHVFESYIKQIVGHLDLFQIACPGPIRSFIKRFYETDQQIPTFREIIHEIFLPLCQSRPGIIFVMDGLDECNRSQTLKVFEALREISKLRSVKVFVSGREGLDMTGAIPGCATINIADDGNNDDLRAFVDWKIQIKMKERQLTESESVLQEIKAKLLERAGHMILWVNLQLEMLWDDCYTDSEIRKSLDSLPKDLSTTYDRCLAKIMGKGMVFARKVLPWVAVAPEPFTGSQLQEAVALNPRTGLLDLDGFVPVKELVKSCSHLITWDMNDEIRLTHYSVSQFLESKGGENNSWFADIALNNERAALGDLCMKHLLSPIYSRPVIPTQKPKQTVVNAGAIMQQLWTHIPLSSRLGFQNTKRVEIRLPLQQSTEKFNQEQPSFFEFAKGQWLPLTKHLTQSSTNWDEFESLVLDQNSTWNIHPWEPLGMSMDSHYAAILGYAIVEHHSPLFSVLMRARGLQPRTDIFRLPLHPYNNLLPLHLAARAGNSDCLVQIMGQSTFNMLDENGQTALHHAAVMGHLNVTQVLLRKGMVKSDHADKDGCTALHVAVSHEQEHLLDTMFVNLANIDQQDHLGRTALHLAVTNKNENVVKALLAQNPNLSITDKAGRNALSIAAHASDTETVRLLLQTDYARGSLLGSAGSFRSVVIRLSKFHSSAFWDLRQSWETFSLLSPEELLLHAAENINPKDVGLKAFELYMEILMESRVDGDHVLRYKLLLAAVGCGNSAMVCRLVEAGISVQSSRLNLSTDPGLSGYFRERLKINQQLELTTALRNNPLVLALEQEHIDSVELLFEDWSFQISSRTELCDKLFNLAAQHGKRQLLENFLKRKFPFHRRALNSALASWNPHLIHLLVSNGVPVTCEVILMALRNEDEALLSKLLECEAVWQPDAVMTNTDSLSIHMLVREAIRLGRNDILGLLSANTAPGDMSD